MDWIKGLLWNSMNVTEYNEKHLKKTREYNVQNIVTMTTEYQNMKVIKLHNR